MRHSYSLNGQWQFQLDPTAGYKVEDLLPDQQIQVPLPWQAAFPELERYSGFAWYRRNIELEPAWCEGTLLLHFGAVDYWCEVYVNRQLVGQHEGGYTPFDFAIQDYVRPGSNEIAVRVYDVTQDNTVIERWPDYPTATSHNQPPLDANHLPHGKQEWYINVGGIWQEVSLSALAATYISRIFVTPDIHSGQAAIKIELAGNLSDLETASLVVKLTDQELVLAQSNLRLTPGQTVYELDLTVQNPRLWEIGAAQFYTVTAELDTSSGQDVLSERFGYREFITQDGQFLLNGQPLFLLSALDQDFYADTIYTVPSEEYLRDQFEKARQLGFNCLRCHIKPPDPRYLDLADEMGLLVWAEIPSWRTFYAKGTVHLNQLNLDELIKQRVEHTLEEMIRRDFNHPSVVIWTIVNEDWGTALPLSENDRAWVGQMYQRCKELDPTRLVVDNSACPHPWGPNVHVQSDLDDFHIYANIPDQANRFEQTIEQYNLRPLWTYSAHGDTRRTGHEPLVLSEFGNWGLPSLKALRQPTGSDPSWFKLGPWWSPWEGEPGWAMGVEDRFRQLGLDQIWTDYEAFAEATQWHQYAAFKFEIEVLRRQPALAGYVVTELADIYWESNGLLDFLRNPKVFHDRFGRINAPDMIIPQVQHYGLWADQTVKVRLHAARYSSNEWQQARLSWRVAGGKQGGEQAVAALKRAEVRSLGLYAWQMPPVEQTQLVDFELKVSGGDGTVLAQNNLELLVLPVSDREARYEGQVAVITRPNSGSENAANLASTTLEGDAGFETTGVGLSQLNDQDEETNDDRVNHSLLSNLQKLGYRARRQLERTTKLAITNYPTAELLEWVREGGDLLFISHGPSPFFWVQNRGGAYSGSWISSFSWLRPQVYRRLAGVANPLQLPFKQVMPTGTILGLPVTQPGVQADFLAGMVSGWVNHPAVHTVQFRYGQGRVIMTTFALDKALTNYNDPVAVAMLHDLLEHLTSEACDPTLRASY